MFTIKPIILIPFIWLSGNLCFSAALDPLTQPPTARGRQILQDLHQINPWQNLCPELSDKLDTHFIEFLGALGHDHINIYPFQISLLNWLEANLQIIFQKLEQHITQYGSLCLLILAGKLPQIFDFLFNREKSSKTKHLQVKIDLNTTMYFPHYYQKHYKELLFQEFLGQDQHCDLKLSLCKNLDLRTFANLFAWAHRKHPTALEDNQQLQQIWKLWSLRSKLSLEEQSLLMIFCSPLFHEKLEYFWPYAHILKKYLKNALEIFTPEDKALLQPLIAQNPNHFFHLMLFRKNKFKFDDQQLRKYKKALTELITKYPQEFVHFLSQEKLEINFELLLFILQTIPDLISTYGMAFEYEQISFQINAERKPLYDFELSENKSLLEKIIQQYPRYFLYLIKNRKIILSTYLTSLLEQINHPLVIKITKKIKKNQHRAKAYTKWQRQRRQKKYSGQPINQANNSNVPQVNLVPELCLKLEQISLERRQNKPTPGQNQIEQTLPNNQDDFEIVATDDWQIVDA